MESRPFAPCPMRPIKLKVGSPILLLSVVISACSSPPSLMRLECSGETVHRNPVFDRQTGQLYSHVQPDDVYQPQPVDRFSVKTKGRIKDNIFVIETRVGEWSKKGDKPVLTAVNPPVGSDFTVDLTSLKTTMKSLSIKDGKPVFAAKFGQCKSIPLATHSVKDA